MPFRTTTTASPILTAAHALSQTANVLVDPIGVFVNDDDGIDLAQQPIHIEVAIEFLQAERAIEAKAAALGGRAGAPSGDVRDVPGGFAKSYEISDIYYGKTTGAHEVHGDIRSKYNALMGAGGVLGLPVTDESVAPGGRGRFNDFEGGSIYWSPQTGAMMVRGAIRDAWNREGGAAGRLGFPVADEHRIVGMFPKDRPNVAWSIFESGAVVGTKDGAASSVPADLNPNAARGILETDALCRLVRRMVDVEIHKSPDNVGLHPPCDIVAVSDWTPGFWQSDPRVVTFRLRGFRDNGLAPDFDFVIDLSLRFRLVWPPSLAEPGLKSLVVTLVGRRVSSPNAELTHKLAAGIDDAFTASGGAIFLTSFPTGVSQTGDGAIDVVDVQTTSTGALQVLVNSTDRAAGGIRMFIAQQEIDAFVARTVGT